MVGVKGLKPSTSRSQTERAINCATPRWAWYIVLYLSEYYQCILIGQMDKAVKKVRHVGQQVRQSKKARFGLVGIVNTVVDFGILNILVGFLGIPVVVANIISTTTAMLTSFALNKRAVFQNEGNTKRQIVLFFTVTLTSIWVVQTAVIAIVHPLLAALPGPLQLNIAKIAGISAGLVWNYMWYSKVVFRTAKDQQE
jgi:putative flippase GtrA